jgi:hypothetical protein
MVNLGDKKNINTNINVICKERGTLGNVTDIGYRKNVGRFWYMLRKCEESV